MDILKEMNSLNDPIRSKSVNKINKVIDDMYKSLIIENPLELISSLICFVPPVLINLPILNLHQ